MTDGVACVIGGSDDGFCRDQVCLPATCGDGFMRNDEQCDHSELGDMTCQKLGYYEESPLACNDACSFDTSMCRGYCGDGRVSGPELCDANPPQLTCVDLGFGAGFLDCNQCAPLTTGCRFVDWQTYYASQAVNDVHGTDDNDIYAVGGGKILRFTNASWSKVDTSACITATENIDFGAVWSFGGGSAIVGGIDLDQSVAIIIKLDATGCVKTIVDPVKATGAVFDLWAAGPADIYAVGTQMGVFHFNGTAWTQVDATSGPQRIWGSGASDVWTAGNQISIRHYNGTSWSPVTIPGIDLPYAVWGSSNTDVYVGGRLNTGTALGGVARFNGATWTTILDTSPYAVRMGATDATHVFAQNGYMTLMFDGTTWTDLEEPDPLSVLHALWISPTGRMVTAANNTIVKIYPGLLLSHSNTQTPGAIRVFVRAPDKATAFQFGAVYDLTGVNTWQQDAMPFTGEDLWVAADGDAYTVYTGDSGFPAGIYRRAAGGSWGTTPTVAMTGSLVWGAPAEDEFWTFDTQTNLSQFQLNHFKNGVVQALCSSCALPTNQEVRQLWGTSPTNVFARGSDFILHWDGSSWTKQPLPPNTILADIHGIAANDIYAVGDTGDVLHYDGTSWQVATNLGLSLNAVHVISAKDVFAGGQFGRLFHYDGKHWAPIRGGTSKVLSIGAAGDLVWYIDESSATYRLVRTASF